MVLQHLPGCMFSEFDQRAMRHALRLAALGRYTTHPNPRVGCVIVQGEHIVGEGWHRKWGEPHAEVLALAAAGTAARDATVYVTLEPHCYQSRMPPCTDALISASVRRVVCATLDANPQVRGAGMRQLQSAGIHVECGLLMEEARELNAGFEKRMLHGMPRVAVKLACSLDGRVALANGASQWLTGPAARRDVQRLRAAAAAVLTGIETVLHDNPRLTVRDPMLDLAGRQPLRAVLDSTLRMPTSARMLSEPGETWVFTATAEPEKTAALRTHGATVHCVHDECTTAVNLKYVLQLLAQQGCNDVLVEAGPTLAGALFESGLVDELILYMAPMLLGPQARPLLRLKEPKQLQAALQLQLKTREQIGTDLKLVYEHCDSTRNTRA